MKVSYNWLKKYIAFDWDAATLAQKLTDCGLEVEHVEQTESIKGGLKGIVLGKVLTCEKHPNADKLSLTTVDAGTGTPLNIVCGAPNVAAGQSVVVALEGAMLYPAEGEPFEIKQSKIRGELSQGMICAEDEIGLGNSHAGIIVLNEEITPGALASDYYKVETDYILEIGLTPNRADAASHIGVARDLQALLANDTEAQLQLPDVKNFTSDVNDAQITVDVEDNHNCIRYSGISISGITCGPSPDWLVAALNGIGQKSINNIVDITNYVLHETGQPLHAFDADKIAGNKVIVKQMPAATSFVTLDGIERKMQGSELMICNETEAMCIAGVFGGIDSGVTPYTKNIFLESACFNPVSIRKTSKLQNLKTDASFRFERGTDPNITVYALKRAALLIKEIAHGKIDGDIIDVYPEKVENTILHLRFDKLNQIAGHKIETKIVEKILLALEIEILNDYHEGLQLSIPPFKVDVKREIDVIEEVMRVYGYNNIPSPKKSSVSLVNFENAGSYKIKNNISQYLVSNGFAEMLSNSLVSENLFENKDELVKLENPLSIDLNVMRPSMLPSMLSAANYNVSRQNADLRLFEWGTIYKRHGEKFIEQQQLCLIITGKRIAENRKGQFLQNDIFYIKALAENILNFTRPDKISYEYNAESDQLIETMRVAVKSGNTKSAFVGTLGKVKKKMLASYDINNDTFFAEININDAIAKGNKGGFRMTEIPKFPEVRRDLSMILDRSVGYIELEKISFETERKLLKNVTLFDVYEGEKIPAGKKSYALSFTLYDDEKTLQDKEIEKVMSKLMEAFEKKLNAEVRK